MTASPAPSPENPSPRESQAERERKLLFDLSLDLMCVAGLDGYFKQVNPSWTRVLGWSREELLSRPITDFMHPDDREPTLEARRNLARGIPVRGLENRYFCKDGTYRWLSWQSSIDPGASTVFAVARDITERRQTDQARLILGKIESTGILAGGIAHDFNNLLAGLLLNLELIALAGPVNAQQSQNIVQARATVQAAKGLTQKLLIFAQGGIEARKVTDLKDLLRQSFDLALGGSNILGETTIAPDLWPTSVDAEQIGQVIRNLVLNAREAMPNGGVARLQAENVTLADAPGLHSPPGDYLRIRITDDGTGIPDEALGKIFDPYFSTKQRGPQKGMGLGLTICHSILQKHGGMIAAEPNPDGGTVITCHLPAARPTDPCRVRPASATPGKKNGPARILVMDDEPGLRELMALTLPRLGYVVRLAENGEEAIALHEQAHASGEPFDAVLLDLTVRGGMGGAETLRILRMRDPSVRAVLMTGYNHEITPKHDALRDFDAALAKPFSIEKLRATLGETLDHTEP